MSYFLVFIFAFFMGFVLGGFSWFLHGETKAERRGYENCLRKWGGILLAWRSQRREAGLHINPTTENHPDFITMKQLTKE